MIRWIYQNINHVIVPYAIVLSVMTAAIGFNMQRRRKAGLPPAEMRRVRGAMLLLVLAACVLFGIALVRNFG